MKRFLTLLLVLAARIYAADGISVALDHYSSAGTVYNYTVTYSAGMYTGQQAYWDAGTPGVDYTYGYFRNVDNYPGYSSAFTNSGQFTIPIGKTGHYAFNFKGTSNTWVYNITNLPAGAAPACPTQTIDFWCDNRSGIASRTIKFAAVDGATVTPVSASVSVYGGAATTMSAGSTLTVAVGSFAHAIVSGSICGTIKMYEEGEDSSFFEAESDPSVPVETRLPDPTSAPSPTITDPTTTALATVPNPSAAFPQRVTDGGLTEDRWTKGILDVVRNSAVSSQVAAENSKAQAQAAAFNAARLQSIDDNIAILKRNSDEERGDRTANYARIDAIKNNTKAIADALKDTGPAPTQQTFDATSNVTSSANATQVTGVLSMLPSVPTITLPEDKSTFSVAFVPPGLTGEQSIAFDLAPYLVPITVFKTLVRAALALAFFFITVKAIRNAFAG